MSAVDAAGDRLLPLWAVPILHQVPSAATEPMGPELFGEEAGDLEITSRSGVLLSSTVPSVGATLWTQLAPYHRVPQLLSPMQGMLHPLLCLTPCRAHWPQQRARVPAP